MAHTYPEHDKFAQVQDKSQLIGDFLDWAAMRDVVFGTHAEDSTQVWFVPTRRPELDKLLAQFLNLDWHKLQAEKDQMLRDAQEGTDACQEKASVNES